MFMQNEQRVTRFLSMEHERPAGRPGPRRHAQPRAGARWWRGDARFRNLNRQLRDRWVRCQKSQVRGRRTEVGNQKRKSRFKICGTNVGQRSTSTIRCDCSPCRRDLCGCGKRAGASASALEVGRSELGLRLGRAYGSERARSPRRLRPLAKRSELGTKKERSDFGRSLLFDSIQFFVSRSRRRLPESCSSDRSRRPDTSSHRQPGNNGSH